MRNVDLHSPPISMMPKWRIFAPSRFHHCCGGDGELSFHFIWSKIVARRWLAKYYSPPSGQRKTTWFCLYIVTNKVTLWAASYSACVVYTKRIVHLRVCESIGYLIPVRWIMLISKFSAPTIAFLAFWLAKKLRLWANSGGFTSYGKQCAKFTLSSHLKISKIVCLPCIWPVK